MADIFISYAREDRGKAEQLAKLFESKGWHVWWDPKIIAGADYRNVIEKKLKEAKCIVVLWSRYSVESNWVINEANEGEQRKILVPAILEKNIKIPFGFQHRQASDLSSWQGDPSYLELESIYKAIEGLLGIQEKFQFELSFVSNEEYEEAKEILKKVYLQGFIKRKKGTRPMGLVFDEFDEWDVSQDLRLLLQRYEDDIQKKLTFVIDRNDVKKKLTLKNHPYKFFCCVDDNAADRGRSLLCKSGVNVTGHGSRDPLERVKHQNVWFIWFLCNTEPLYHDRRLFQAPPAPIFTLKHKFVS